MKAAIITLYYKNNNYGGIAQAWALQKYIEMLGAETEVLNYKRTSPPMFLQTNNGIKNKFKNLPQKLNLKINNKFAHNRYYESLKKNFLVREKAFENSRDMVRHSCLYTDETIKETADRYDVFISGSDQIWKPGTIRDAFVWGFLPDGKKRISYASSISMSNLSDAYGKFMKERLAKYSSISVRESEAARYLEKISGRSVATVVDPTLLLTDDIWNDFAAANRKINERYMFAYMLGEDVRQRKHIIEIAKERKLKIVTLPHIEGYVRACDTGFGDIEMYDIDLPEFLGLIKNAELVCTDSFHGVVFSNIFETEFFVYERSVLDNRYNMNSRLENFLNITDSRQRLIDISVPVKALNKIPYTDFGRVKALLDKERKKSQKWLERALRQCFDA